MLTHAKILFAFFVPLTMGLLIVRMLFRHRPIPGFLALAVAYWLGTGLLTQWMLILSALKMPFNFIIIAGPLIFATLMLILVEFQSGTLLNMFGENSYRKPYVIVDFISLLLALFVAFEVSFSFWHGMNIPPIAYDAFATVALKSKVIFYERTIGLQRYFPHYSYPLHIPFLQAWLTITLGEWNDQVIKYIFPFYLLSILVGLYYCLKLLTNRRSAWVGLALTCSSAFFVIHSSLSYRDFTVMTYNTWVIIALVFWFQQNEDKWLFLAGLASGFASFSKLEGSFYIVIHLILIFFLLAQRRPPLQHLRPVFFKFFMPSVGIVLFYVLYLKFNVGISPPSGVSTRIDLNLGHIDFAFSRIQFLRAPFVLRRILENLFMSGNWSLLGALFLLSCFRPRKTWHWSIKMLGLGLLLFLFIDFVAYTFTQYHYWIRVDTTLSRTLLHFYPLIPMLIILLNQESLN